MIRIFDALLRLAEIDAGLRRSGFVALDVADLAANAAEFYAPAAELRGIDLTFRSGGSLWVSGDPILLAQALSNLIDNALKYVPVNGAIEVGVQRRGDLYSSTAPRLWLPVVTNKSAPKSITSCASRFKKLPAPRGWSASSQLLLHSWE